MSFVQALLSNPAIPDQDRQEALDRAFSDPGLPTTNATSSFWLSPPHPDLANVQSSTFPSEAEVIIIGSGVTGTSVARTLLKSRRAANRETKRPAVVILEARSICSGATGRNGGHILETAEEFADLEDLYGREEARKIMNFRLAHLREILATAEEYGLTKDCQARKVQFLSVYFNEKGWKDARDRLRRLKEGLPEETKEWTAYEREEIPEEFCLPHAHGIVAGPGGAIWPYRFITGVLSQLQKEFPQDLVIETNTPVKGIEEQTDEGDGSLRYTVSTSRGVIRARHVIHCTNAHVSHLVPGLRGRIYPIRGQMSAQHAGQAFPCQGEKHSWIFNYDRGMDYLTQLPPTKTGPMMMFGGGFAQGEGGGIADLGIAADSELSLYADIHLSGALSAVFGRDNWGVVPRRSVEKMWAGTMGFSADGLPWVGPLPASVTHRGLNKEGCGAEWVSAAFSGEGMVLAWLCGKALATLLLIHDDVLLETESRDLSWVPKQMLVTEERIEKAVLPRHVQDM
ncbi:NAD(P)/FAD-dependent oxidoreductase [Aspergillus ibericus CBS 121593]|uniref:DAO-domain-containing protein n=1 Tax=Aspergillus ibericus CBS 121593 TaxID=1448316 RepID=A0A395GIW2_9EURO|nr:DAO-domain-containing protein [Aspergillus ibericus CBS 121593]RAK95304.1 DAO-domain-containing protein [Aspergillus ibericus CBS 121593]